MLHVRIAMHSAAHTVLHPPPLVGTRLAQAAQHLLPLRCFATGNTSGPAASNQQYEQFDKARSQSSDSEEDEAGFDSNQGSHTEEECKPSPQTLISRILRSSHAAEKAAAAFYAGANAGSGGRPDFAYFKEQELEAQQKVSELLPAHRVRPSLLQGHLAAGGYVLGLIAGVAPQEVKLALIGAVSEALEEHYNDALRESREQPEVEEQAPGMREALRDLRDVPRAPAGTPPVPDITMLQRLEKIEELGVAGAAALAAKMACRAALSAAATT